MSEIQFLALRVRDLSHSVDWWNAAMIWGLALAAIAAVFVVIATRVVVSRTGELSAAQDLLSEAKDRERDVKIAEAQRGIAEANDRAGAASERASRADERAATNEKQAAELRKRAEDEAIRRAELEAKVAWRTLDETEQKDFADRLKALPKQLVECAYLANDMEAFSFASDLASAFRKINAWRVIPPSQSVMMFRTISGLPTSSSGIVPLETGIELRSTTEEGTRAATQTIALELRRRGFNVNDVIATEAQPKSDPEPRIWLYVLHRPLGAQGEAKLRENGANRQ